MSNEREKLIKEDQEFVSFPPPDYSKMTNETIKMRTEMFRSMFRDLYNKKNGKEE
jgi:hypothetical protein